MQVERMFVEPGKMDCCPGDPYGESSPEVMVDYLKKVSDN